MRVKGKVKDVMKTQLATGDQMPPSPTWHRRSSCEVCGSSFYLYGRHHCRACGRSVCDHHFSRPFCTYCLQALQSRTNENQLGNGAVQTPQRTTAHRSDERSAPPGTEDVVLAKDVYATAFTLLNNATPSLYSCSPFQNRAMWLSWFYLFFIAFSQTFVLVSMLLLTPPVVASRSVFIDCDDPASLIIAHGSESASSPAPLSSDACRALEPALAVGGKTLRAYEIQSFYYTNMFTGDAQHIFLQLVCCVWVTVQVYFVDFRNVAALLRFRDFIRWLQPLKGEEVRSNGWVMFIPLLQYALGLLVVLVSCTVTCGTGDAFEVVLNSLAFTFISQVARFFNEPLLQYYTSQRILGLDEEVYGSEPIYYLVSDYSEENAAAQWVDSWYVREEEQLAGLVTDFRFRHTPGAYPRPNEALIRGLRVFFFVAPVGAMVLCWALFTRQNASPFVPAWMESLHLEALLDQIAQLVRQSQ